MLEVAGVARGIEGLGRMLRLRLVFGQDDVVLVGQPTAGFGEGLVEIAHRQVDGASVGSADEAAEGVAADLE